jgi:hypothetical protein
MANLIWIEGPTRSGKTAHLLTQLQMWNQEPPSLLDPGKTWLWFAATGDNRLALVDRVAATLPNPVPLTTATPAGFVQREVTLFWPLLVESLGLSPQFPMKLRPEKEQELATHVWADRLQGTAMAVPGWTVNQTVRRSLDFLQLAASAGVPAENIGSLLQQGMLSGIAEPEVWAEIGGALLDWREICWRQGLVTYGIATELYWRYLLPMPAYQSQWQARFAGVLADDGDEYPAMMVDVLTMALGRDTPVAVSFNPQGQVRLGVGADGEALYRLRDGPNGLACDHRATEVISLPTPAPDALAYTWADPLVQAVLDPLVVPEPIPAMMVVQTTSRGELLRHTAEAIAAAIQAGAVTAGEIAVIGPGFDAIARYTLAEILVNQGIPVASLNDQRPLVSTPLVRAILTLMPLVYPGLGRWVDRDAIAEMLVVLSQSATGDPHRPWIERVQIDPVRAELITDHCFRPDPDRPDLLPVTEFPRWDRLGYQATEAYNRLCQWIQEQRQALQQRLIATPVNFIDRAIQAFLWRGNYLPADQLAALRELLETAQHFWQVEERLRQQQMAQTGVGWAFTPLPSPGGGAAPELAPLPSPTLATARAEARFLALLLQGTVTANPFPVKPLDSTPAGVTLATVFQYRAQRLTHRWQFWLDAGSPRWLTGSDALLGYPIFQTQWSGQPWTVDTMEAAHEARLGRILRDLLGRTTERVILCHSDLAVNGQEQTGPLLGLVNALTATQAEPGSSPTKA